MKQQRKRRREDNEGEVVAVERPVRGRRARANVPLGCIFCLFLDGCDATPSDLILPLGEEISRAPSCNGKGKVTRRCLSLLLHFRQSTAPQSGRGPCSVARGACGGTRASVCLRCAEGRCRAAPPQRACGAGIRGGASEHGGCLPQGGQVRHAAQWQSAAVHTL